MKLTAAQTATLTRVAQADLAWREGKTLAHARAKEIAEQEVANLLSSRDYAVRLAFEAGVPKAKIGQEGLSTRSPNTVLESLARTEDVAAAVVGLHADPLAFRYAFTATPDGDAAGILTVSLDPSRSEANAAAWAWAMEEGNWKAPATVATAHPALTYATFAPGQFGGFAPITEGWLPEHLNRHPVIVWMEQDENKAEAAAWLQGQAPAADTEARPVANLSDYRAA